ncbi:MAG: amidophosphoribosyltransferase [Planctomycetota bacterium]
MGPEGTDVVADVLAGLLAVQHRGQDAAGIVTFDDRFFAKKGRGLVRDVLDQGDLARLTGSMGVGHVRYPTVGGNADEDVQPFWVDFPVGIAMAHNGNVTNFHELKDNYFRQQNPQGRLGSNCDLEAVLYVFAGHLFNKGTERLEPADVRDAVSEVFRVVKGAYSVAGVIAGAGMYAFRDPYGIKPAILGRRDSEEGTSFAVASESVVLDVAGYEVVRDLKAGELLWIDNDRNFHSFELGEQTHRPCVFEYVYFSRPDSTIDTASVYESRVRLGRSLAHRWQSFGLEADAVIPVPESACTAAQSMAEELGIPYREGFVKNRYVGRTFIMPNDKARRSSIRQKLNPIRSEFEGKSVLIVDDSIVRGNTSRQIVKVARQMGAKKVYLASYSPPLRFPCPYGIDMSTKTEFIARDRDEGQIAAEIGADKVVYQELDEMIETVASLMDSPKDFCRACFNGEYPTEDVTDEMWSAIERDRIAASQ